MTIDEAIAQEREMATACDTPCMDKYDCMKCRKGHEQIAEWLEELKAYRTLDKTNFSDGYNKAIDDFVEKVQLHYLGVHPDELYEKYYPREICITFKEIAEQLKGERK